VFRQLLYDNTWPSIDDAAWCVGWAIAAAVAGYAIFSRHERRLAELL
jgi:ABC-type polysaccharide/polyol phosphate export permease